MSEYILVCGITYSLLMVCKGLIRTRRDYYRDVRDYYHNRNRKA